MEKMGRSYRDVLLKFWFRPTILNFFEILRLDHSLFVLKLVK